MLPVEIIAKKRDQQTLSRAEIKAFVQGITDESWSEGQVAAMAMAIWLHGMDVDERVALTLSMRDSGTILQWGHLHGPVLDKHSTGGIGDKVSLILGPVLAACGAYVPMLSGRGLGHTGGTLDKLDAIPGFNTQPDLAGLEKIVSEAGCAIVGQTDDLAPADRRLYAIRDLTATVDSLPLIVASILAKKLASGADALVMDVKFGSGAFMPTPAAARELAEAILAVARGAGLPSCAAITDMNQCLGRFAGNALEVREAVIALTDNAMTPRLRAVTSALGAELLQCAGLDRDGEAAAARIDLALTSGKAAEHFAKMVHCSGGPADFLERPDRYLPKARFERPVLAPRDGFVSAIDVKAIGLAVIELGGGRRQPGDALDYGVGIEALAELGDAVCREQPLAVILSNDLERSERAYVRLQTAFSITDSRPDVGSAVLEIIQ